MRGLGKGVSGKPYPRLCNARRPRLEPGTFRSQAVRLYRLHQARPSNYGKKLWKINTSWHRCSPDAVNMRPDSTPSFSDSLSPSTSTYPPGPGRLAPPPTSAPPGRLRCWQGPPPLLHPTPPDPPIPPTLDLSPSPIPTPHVSTHLNYPPPPPTQQHPC